MGAARPVTLRTRVRARPWTSERAWALAWWRWRWGAYAPAQRRLIARWIRATIAAYLAIEVALAALVGAPIAFPSLRVSDLAQYVVNALVTGLCLGVAQAVVLRGTDHWRRGALRWPLLVAGTMVAVGVVLYGVTQVSISRADRWGDVQVLVPYRYVPWGLWSLVAAGLTGAVVGLLQVVFLLGSAEPPIVTRSGVVRIWVAASVGGWCVARLTRHLLEWLLTLPDVWPAILRISMVICVAALNAAVAGLVIGGATAPVLAWMGQGSASPHAGVGRRRVRRLSWRRAGSPGEARPLS